MKIKYAILSLRAEGATVPVLLPACVSPLHPKQKKPLLKRPPQ